MGMAMVGAYVITIPDRIASDRADEADRRWRKQESLERYGRNNCPDAFVDICWEFDPSEASMALSAQPPWETYKRIVEHLRKQPLPLDDKRSLEVYKGVRRGLLNGLTRRQYAAALADAAYFVESAKAGDGVSAAMLLSALARTVLPARLHLSSPDEWKLAGQIASLLVPAYERTLAELSDAAQKAQGLQVDEHGPAYALARAEFCLASAYEFAAFIEQDPAEKAHLLAKAFAVYARATERPSGGTSEYFLYWSLPVKAAIAGSRVAATDEQRLELARRLKTTMNLELRRDSGESWPGVYHHTAGSRSLDMNYFLYDAVRPDSRWLPLFLKIDKSKLPYPTLMNMAILEIRESCDSAEARRTVVEILLGMYDMYAVKASSVKASTGYISKGAVAELLLELYVRSGEEHWLRSGPGYLRKAGDSLPASDWNALVKQARRQRTELLAQINAPNLCCDADSLVIRLGDFGLITDQAECAWAHELIVQYPLASERRSSLLGSEYGTERYIWEWPSR
jgi:hypothetical protein